VYHDETCPVLAGVVDPAAGGRRAAALASERTGTPVYHPSLGALAAEARTAPRLQVEQGPRIAAIVERFTAQVPTGDVQPCAHLSRSASQDGPRAWLPWVPERLLCPACFAAAMQRVAGTPEGDACDHCHQPPPADPADGKPLMYSMAIPADGATVYLGLCGPCLAADQVG
jgi:hypothetical protein